MKYIDKTLMKEEGEKIVTEFLDCFYKRINKYPDDMYKAFGNEIDDNHNHTKFRQRLIDQVLMPEQDGRCCYCMRDLSKGCTVTVEHIMPNHSVNKAELDLYRTRKTELDGLPHPNEFKSMIPITYPPHPHTIAYQNLVLSCNGIFFSEDTKAKCCNLKRKHKFLPPFLLYDNIATTFIYYANGFVEWTEDSAEPGSPHNAIKILGLNCPILRMIRKIWFFCNDHKFDPRTNTKDEIINTMMGFISVNSLDESEINMLLNFKNEKYWKLLLEYDAFADIKHC